mmetsp:Transcript_5013/g.6686  ORF Transcript_5013/g.6686 Transcript_5013/m.6686 type:complete len:100 (+) Transcript_5013:22-321(+)
MATRRLATFDAKKLWFTHAETWPVIACIGVAVGWCGFVSTTYLTKSPDVQWVKSDRGSILRDTHTTTGEKWVSHKKGFVVNKVETIGMYEAPDRKYSKH